MRGDPKTVRVQAVARRVLQVGANPRIAPLWSPLLAVREVQKKRKAIMSCLKNVQEDDTDDEIENLRIRKPSLAKMNKMRRV